LDIYHKILLQYWGYQRFRPLQEDIIHSIADGKDTLALMPTGGGKSLTFQVPAMAQEGICLVITPLIALMKDQVENLKKLNIKAIAIYSGMTKNEIDIALDNCIFGDIKFLYISPERISTEIFRFRVKKMNVNLIAIDESHCISQWGYDFRPSYLKIVELRELIPGIPFIALTATATPDVVKDIQDKLQFKEKNVLQISFERKNLVYLVREIEDKNKYLLDTLKKINGSGIIYARSRKKTRETSDFLRKNNISTDYYHAGLKHEVRSQKQNEWKTGNTRIMVSTNAFGMGIDKSNVRFVIHLDLPDNIESYFQEAGRAGRDEKKAYAVLLYNNSDKVKAENRIATNFPEISTIKDIYQNLASYFTIPNGGGKHMSFDFNLGEFASRYKYNILTIFSSLKFLQKEGLIEYTDELYNTSKIHFTINRNDLYKFQIANENFDNFIKLLLRSYTGLFSDYANIDELSLARKSRLDIKIIYNYLNKLKTMGIINYIPKKNNPVITFTEERLDKNTLTISKKNYSTLKDRFTSRITATINYASSNNKCRSQILLSYFGEQNSTRCGECDVCNKRNELNLSKYEFDIILKDLKKILSEENLKLDSIVNKLRYNKEKIIKVIRWLIDNKKIIKAQNEEYKLNI
jgi:ATP-dependent DNA helicase RecQ